MFQGIELVLQKLKMPSMSIQMLLRVRLLDCHTQLKRQGLYAFIIPTNTKRDPIELEKEIRDLVQKIIGPIAKPDLIQSTEGLPKTRSGKIMRRILRKIVENDLDSIGDTSTLLNPEIVETLIAEKKVLPE